MDESSESLSEKETETSHSFYNLRPRPPQKKNDAFIVPRIREVEVFGVLPIEKVNMDSNINDHKKDQDQSSQFLKKKLFINISPN